MMDEEKFSQWIQNLTEGSILSRNGKLPTGDQLSSLLKVNGFVPVLDYMMTHVRPPQEREHIRRNLRHSHFRKHLAEEKNVTEIQKKHSKLVTLVQEAEKELHAEAEELRRTVEEEKKLETEEKNIRCQIALLNTACRERRESLKKLKNQKEAVSQLLPQSSKFVSPKDESIKQQSATEEIDIVLGKLKELRMKILANKEEDFHDQKLEVWTMVEEMIGHYHPLTLLKALNFVISRETNQVSQTTNAVDLVADAKALNLEYKNGVYTDVLNPHGILETDDFKILQMSSKHIKKHLAFQKLKQETKLTKDSLQVITNSIQSVLNEEYNDSVLVAGIIDLFKATIRVSGLKASISAASSMINDFETRAELAKKGKESVEDKFNRINSFEETVEQRNVELKQLVVAISHSLKELEDDKENLIPFVERRVNSLVLPTPFMKGAFSKECDALQNVPFEALATRQTDHGPVPCSSIGPAENLYSDLSDLSQVVPYVTYWEDVLETIRQRKSRLRENDSQLAKELSDLEVMTKKSANQPLSSYTVKALREKVQLHDQRLEDDLMPILQKFEETNDDGGKIISRFADVVEEWWNQTGPEIENYLKDRKTKL